MNKFLLYIIIAMLPVAAIQAQESRVTGSVTSVEGALPGVNVLIKGTSNGTVTDFDGNYVISTTGDATLVFSFIGYKAQEVVVGNQTKIDVYLEEDIASLEEIVVIGYGEQKKSVATTAISKVGGEDLGNLTLPNIGKGMQGLVSGVSVSGASGQPGSRPTIMIRGIGTNGDNQPLIVVDGLQMPDNFDIGTIPAADVSSVEILKDAASTAIYGTRGANGVIYVTTKSGKTRGMEMSYSGTHSVQQAWRIPEMLNAEQYVELINEKYEGNPPVGFPAVGDPLPANTNWMEEVFEPANLQTHTLSISRNSENGQLYSSFSLWDQEGIIAPDKSNYQQITARLNSSTNVNEYISIGQKFTFVNKESQTIPENNEFGTPLGDALAYDPITPVYVDTAQFGFGQSPFVQKEYVNPLSRIFIGNNKSTDKEFYGNAYLELSPLSYVKFRTDIGAQYWQSVTDSYSPAYQLTPAFFQTSSNVAHTYRSNFQWQWENYISANKQIDKHSAEVVLGTTAIKSRYKEYGASGMDLPIEAIDNVELRYVNATPDSSRRSYGIEGAYKVNSSYFGRILYNYDEKYMLTASVRRDGSTNFGSENRFAIFPAFSVGWVVSNENFFPTSILDFTKLRVSYGSNGNDRISPFSYTGTIATNRAYPFGGQSTGQTIYYGASPTSIANPEVRWEESKQLDVGLELRALQSRLALEVDYYNKTTDGLLIVDQSIPILAGNNASFANVGEVKNTGIEFKIDYNDNIGDIDVGVSLNGTTLKNEVTRVDGQAGIQNGYTWPVRNAPISRMEVGEPIYYFRGYTTDGIFQNQSEVFSHISSTGQPLQPDAQPGDLRIVDTNGDGEINQEDWGNIGDPWADFVLGLNIQLAYKGVDFQAVFSASFGNQIYRTFERQDVPLNNYTTEWLDRWSETNTGGQYPRVTTDAGSNTNYAPSDFYVEDGDYMRMRSLQIGYTFPQDWVEKVFLQKARIYFTANNLFTITGYSGFDPEIGVQNYNVSAAGMDRGFYPQIKSYGGGLQITF